MKLRYAAPAIEHLGEIRSFIAADNPNAALRVLRDIRSTVDLIQTSPNAGRRGHAQGTRERIVRRRPYVVVYRFDAAGDLLTILGVYHMARRRP